MSPAIKDAATIARMQAALKDVRDLSDETARATAYMGSKVLQDSGIVVINHDGSAFAAQ